jgi:hypothetical protein
MKSEKETRKAGWFRAVLRDILWPREDAGIPERRCGRWTRQGLAVVLSALMIMVPLWQSEAFAQSPPPPDEEQSYPQAMDDGQQAPQGEPLSAEQLDQLVAPIALYPDALLAQILAAATYPTQVVEADRWRQAQGNAPAEQIAAGAEAQNWDASVKALTAFPTVLAQMDRNIQWTTDLGNAYYNQPQDVMNSVQEMRQKAQAAGQLRSTPQQVVTNDDGAIAIAPANPAVVYVPVYNPSVVYGAPVAVYPGYYYAPPPGVFWGGVAIGFGVGIGIGLFAHWGWGWGHWGIGWPNHAVFYNHNAYITHSATVINRGFNRPGGPPRNFAARGAYPRPSAGFNRPGGTFNRPNTGYRASNNAPRPGGSYARPGGAYGRPSSGTVNHPTASSNRPTGSYNRPTGSYSRPSGTSNHPIASSNRPAGNYGYSRPTGAPRPSSPGTSMSRGPSASYGGGHPSGSAHPSYGGQPNAGSHSSYGGHPSGGSSHPSYSGAHASGGGHSSGGGGHASGGHSGGGHRG